MPLPTGSNYLSGEKNHPSGEGMPSPYISFF